MDIGLANQNYFDKEFFNIKTFDTLITRNKNDGENNSFFDKYPSIYGIYVSSNHVNVYIILFNNSITIPTRVDIKHEENVINNENGIVRKYYLKPDYAYSTEILFFEKPLKGTTLDLVFHSPKNNELYRQKRFCYNESGPVQQLSISYGFSKEHFIKNWNAIKLRCNDDDDDDDIFNYTFLHAPYSPKINVIFITKVSPIRYFDKEKLFRPGAPMYNKDDDYNEKSLVGPNKPSYIVNSPKRNTDTEVYISDMDFTPIASPTHPTVSVNNVKQSIPPLPKPTSFETRKTRQAPKPLRASLREPLAPKPKNKKKQDKDDDPHIFRK